MTREKLCGTGFNPSIQSPVKQSAAYGLKGNISTVLASLLLARSFLRNTSIWTRRTHLFLPLYSVNDLQTGRFLRVFSLIGSDPLVNKVVSWTARYWLRKHDKSGLKFLNISICQPQSLVWAGLPTSKSVIIYKKGLIMVKLHPHLYLLLKRWRIFELYVANIRKRMSIIWMKQDCSGEEHPQVDFQAIVCLVLRNTRQGSHLLPVWIAQEQIAFHYGLLASQRCLSLYMDWIFKHLVVYGHQTSSLGWHLLLWKIGFLLSMLILDASAQSFS